MPQEFRYRVNIPYCISQWRKSRLGQYVAEFLWAAGLARLLRERGIKATVLAEHAHVPASRISELKKSDRPFLPLIQQLVDGFNTYDRTAKFKAETAVEVWEFFVSDEQSAALRHLKAAHDDALRKSTPDSLADQIRSLRESVDALERQVTPAEPPAIVHRNPRRKRA